MPQDAIQALDVALKHAAMMSPILVPVARAFFNPGTARTLGAGAEVGQWLLNPTCRGSGRCGRDCQRQLACSSFMT